MTLKWENKASREEHLGISKRESGGNIKDVKVQCRVADTMVSIKSVFRCMTYSLRMDPDSGPQQREGEGYIYTSVVLLISGCYRKGTS